MFTPGVEATTGDPEGREKELSRRLESKERDWKEKVYDLVSSVKIQSFPLIMTEGPLVIEDT